MKDFFLILLALLVLFLPGCAPIGSIARHELDSGYYKLESEKDVDSKVYAEVYEDSIVVFRMKEASSKNPDPYSRQATKISNIGSENYLFGSRFVKNSVEVDLSTILTKLRPSSSGVPAQLNANLNAAVYMGARKDFYVIKSHKSVLNKNSSSIKHLGYDAGIFAGIGVMPINPTVTNDNTTLEYDGIVFQRGIGAFITIDNASVGITLGFDKLIGGDSKIWIYNNKPYLGLALGIANF
ncbi:MAG TPA: hypothetical protein VMW32_04365 [Bacteroidales bacterium]|nr:hypothetical protein [Bacteroidales bacterium]